MLRGKDNLVKQNVLSDPADIELSIDTGQINHEIMDQPLLMRKWTKLKAEVSARAKSIKDQVKRTEAGVRLGIMKGEKGLKVKDIDAHVELDPQVIKVKDELIEAERLLEEYEGIVRAFYQRHESLKDLAANIRKEVID